MWDRLNAFNKQWGFTTGKGIDYNYGVWKPVKKKFRFIAGTRSPPPSAQATDDATSRAKGPPRKPLYHLNKALVRLLKAVRQALIEKDEDRQLKESRKCWWGIDSMKAFAQLVCTHAREF